VSLRDGRELTLRAIVEVRCWLIDLAQFSPQHGSL